MSNQPKKKPMKGKSREPASRIDSAANNRSNYDAAEIPKSLIEFLADRSWRDEQNDRLASLNLRLTKLEPPKPSKS